jgi:hypothetical protein
MSYRPGVKDFTVATGADHIFAVRFHRRGDAVPAADIVTGDWIVYQGVVWPVYDASPAGAGKVTFRLGTGTFYEPTLTLADDDLVTKADAATWEAIDMQVALPDTPTSPPPTTIPVPTEIHEEDGTVCVITIGQTWLEPFQAQIDYAAGGPSGMSLPYDLVGVFGGLRVRVLTGTINIIRSAASPVVDPPEEVVP